MDAQTRTRIINVRATPNEYKDVERIMQALNVSQSDAVRAAIKFAAGSGITWEQVVASIPDEQPTPNPAQTE